MPERKGNDRQRAATAGRIIAGVAATTSGLVVGGAAGSIAGAFAAAALVPVFEQVAEFDRQAADNAAATVGRAAELADLTPEQLAAWARGSRQRLALLGEVVQAAWRVADEMKTEALARVLADGVEDDARLDLDPLFVAAIREMEPAHVQTLHAMAAVVNAEDVGGDQPVGESGEWATDHLIEHLPHLAEGMHYIVATLDRVGCIERGVTRYNGDSWWSVTPFGQACLGFLRTA